MRLITLIFMLLAPTAFAGQGEQDLSKFFDQTPNAPTQSAPVGDSLPDLSKAPKWRDIAAKPEFQALPPAKQFEAKVAYFDYWIAPHVVADGRINGFAEVRTEFLRQLGTTSAKQQPGTLLSDEQVFGKQQIERQATGSWWEAAPIVHGLIVVNTNASAKTIDIQLPDGMVIQGVPEEMSLADIVAKLKANGYDTSWYKPERTGVDWMDDALNRASKGSAWGHFAWPHYVVLGIAVIGIAVLIRTLRTRAPSPAIPPKAVAPAGDTRMNDRQRKILIAIATLIGLMLIYPPYQLHTGVGWGYSWIFSPPNDGYAVINASQLLVQWVAVLLIGGIAFALSGPVSLAATMNPATALTPAAETIISAPQATPANSGLAPLYEAAIGEKSRAYYLTKFEAFDQFQTGLRPSWNWAAFLVGGVWALYRKMYGWFFAFWGVELATQLAFMVFLKLGSPGVGLFVFFMPWIAFSVYANSLYHRNVKKKIAVAQFSIKDESRLIEHLRRKGGVHTWVIWLFGLVPLLGIVAAVVILMLARH